MKNNRNQYHLPKELEDDFFKDALAVARHSRVDELNCSKSFHRQQSLVTIDEVLEFRKTMKYMNVVIHRDMSFLPQEYLDDDRLNPNRNYWDIGLCTLAEHPADYFLWIELEENDGFDLVKKYNLELK